MRRTFHIAALVGLLAPGCIEYEPQTRLPPLGEPNPRELDAQTHTDVLVQAQVPMIDVLWIVDNSSSMAEEQNGIANNFPIFLDFFVGSGLDWHIGVISTDIYDTNHQGKLVQRMGHRWIDPLTPFPEQVLSEMTRLGTEGSGDERGRDPIWMSMTEHGDGWNDGFYRDDASLHMVVISDEEDSSDRIDEEEWLRSMEELKWGEHELTFSSIVAPDPICPGANDPGVEYIRYTERLGGIFWEICDDNWPEVLEQLGFQAIALNREYFLSQIPVPETIEVFVDDNGVVFVFEPEVDYAYDAERNSVIFHSFTPDPLTGIHISYIVAD